MTKIHTVQGGDALNIHVREWGNPSGPAILLIHGWSQNHLCWVKQYESELAEEFRIVALDLRGHGMSDSPSDVTHYNRSELWAADIDAIITQLDLTKPVLNGWSYGGLVIADYVRIYGTEKIGAINFVGAAPALNEAALGKLIGPGFYENFEPCTNPDLAISLPAIAKFLHDCFEIEPSPADFELMLGFNALVRPEIRANLAARDLHNADILASIDLPVLVTHGRQDKVVLPASGELFLDVCKNSQSAWYEGVGHVPFVEDAARFNRELAMLVREVN